MSLQRDRSEQQARELADRWAAAERQGDAESLDRILTTDFMAVGPRGFLLNREDWLARHQSRDLNYTSFVLSEVLVRVYGPVAVLIGRQTQVSTYKGQPVPMTDLRTTLVCVREEGEWQLAGLQLSPIMAG